jgi:hypothetical protein
MLTHEEERFLFEIHGSWVWWVKRVCGLCGYKVSSSPGPNETMASEMTGHQRGHAQAIPAPQRAALLSLLSMGVGYGRAFEEILGIDRYPDQAVWKQFWKEHGG